MMIRSYVYTLLIGDHVVDLPSNILEQHIFLCVLDIYPVITRKRPDPLQIQCYKYRSLAFCAQFLVKLTHFSMSLDLYHIIYFTTMQ